DGSEGGHALARIPLVGVPRRHRTGPPAPGRSRAGGGAVRPRGGGGRGEEERMGGGPAGGAPPYRGEKLLDVADAVLQQVADTFRRVREELHRQPKLDVLRQYEDTRRGEAGADLERRAQALVAVRRRQADVDDDDIHRFASELGEQLLGIAALSNDVHSGLGEKP